MRGHGRSSVRVSWSSTPATKQASLQATSLVASTGARTEVIEEVEAKESQVPNLPLRKSARRAVPWGKLPDTVVASILQLLHDEERCLLEAPAMVCHQWRRVAFEVMLYDTAASRPGRLAPAASVRGAAANSQAHGHISRIAGSEPGSSSEQVAADTAETASRSAAMDGIFTPGAGMHSRRHAATSGLVAESQHAAGGAGASKHQTNARRSAAVRRSPRMGARRNMTTGRNSNILARTTRRQMIASTNPVDNEHMSCDEEHASDPPDNENVVRNGVADADEDRFDEPTTSHAGPQAEARHYVGRYAPAVSDTSAQGQTAQHGHYYGRHRQTRHEARVGLHSPELSVQHSTHALNATKQDGNHNLDDPPAIQGHHSMRGVPATFGRRGIREDTGVTTRRTLHTSPMEYQPQASEAGHAQPPELLQGEVEALQLNGIERTASVGMASVGEIPGGQSNEMIAAVDGMVASTGADGGGDGTPASLTIMNNAGVALGPGGPVVDQEASMGKPASSTRAQLHVTPPIEPLPIDGEVPDGALLAFALPDHDDGLSNVGQYQGATAGTRRTHRRAATGSAAATRTTRQHHINGNLQNQQEVRQGQDHPTAPSHHGREAIRQLQATPAAIEATASVGPGALSHTSMPPTRARHGAAVGDQAASPPPRQLASTAGELASIGLLHEALSVGPAPAALPSVDNSGTSSEVGPLAGPSRLDRLDSGEVLLSARVDKHERMNTRHGGGGIAEGLVTGRRHNTRHATAIAAAAAAAAASIDTSHAAGDEHAPREEGQGDVTAGNGDISIAVQAAEGSWQGQNEANHNTPQALQAANSGGPTAPASATASDASWGMWGNPAQALQEWVRGPQTRRAAH